MSVAIESTYLDLYYMSVNEQLGLRIKDLRIKGGLSQEAFANKAQIDRTYIPSIEKGERNISIAIIHKIATALGLSLSELFIGIN